MLVICLQALKLGSDLGRVQKEYKKKSQQGEADIQRLVKELSETKDTVERREGELQRLQERFTLDMDEQREHLTTELTVCIQAQILNRNIKEPA